MRALLLSVFVACGREPVSPPEAAPVTDAPTAQEAAPSVAPPEAAPAASPEAAAAPATEPVAAPLAAAPAAAPSAPKSPVAVTPTAPATPPVETAPAATAAATEVAPPAAAAGPRRYTLSPGESTLQVQVFKNPDTVAAGLSHDHVMLAKGWSGQLTWDPANPGACAGEIRVPVDKLEVDPPKARQRVGYDSTLSESQRGEVRDHMLDKGQLDAGRYPAITFTLGTCAGSGESITVNGTFGMRGMSRPLTVKATIREEGDTIQASTRFSILGSDYGLKPFSAMMGALQNQDKLSFTVEVRGKAD